MAEVLQFLEDCAPILSRGRPKVQARVERVPRSLPPNLIDQQQNFKHDQHDDVPLDAQRPAQELAFSDQAFHAMLRWRGAHSTRFAGRLKQCAAEVAARAASGIDSSLRRAYSESGCLESSERRVGNACARFRGGAPRMRDA